MYIYTFIYKKHKYLFKYVCMFVRTAVTMQFVAYMINLFYLQFYIIKFKIIVKFLFKYTP